VVRWSGSEDLDVENNGGMKSMQKYCSYNMHRVHKDYKDVEQTRDDNYCREELHMGKWHVVGRR
jgi:hypothetical protein